MHVAPHGSDLLPGHAPRWPLRSLGRALRLVEPGETIVLWPGVYRETLHWRRSGRPGLPIRLRAAIPGQAVISGAAADAAPRRWRWRRIDARIHSTRPPWPLQALRVDGEAAFQAHNLEEFQRLCRRPGAWPPLHQQLQPQRLWLCLPDGHPAASHAISVHRPLPRRSNAGGHQNASLWIEASHLEISHLHFDMAVGAAIQLVAASHVRIAHNLFTGADIGVNSNPSRRLPSHIQIEHNAFHHSPQAAWRSWLSWRELYRYSNSSLASLGGADLVIEANLITHSGDALQLAPSGGHNRVSGNLIAAGTDDAVELDGAAAPLDLHHNLIADSFANLSFSPMPQGQVRVRANLFLNGPANGHNTWLKLLGGPVQGLSLSHNLVVAEWIGWYSGSGPLHQIHSQHNHLFSRHPVGPVPTPLLPGAMDRSSPLAAASWPAPAAGPQALASPVPPLRFQQPAPGPCWLDARRQPGFQAMRPLLASAWLQPPYRPGRCR